MTGTNNKKKGKEIKKKKRKRIPLLLHKIFTTYPKDKQFYK
jgi:hypothetical protein